MHNYCTMFITQAVRHMFQNKRKFTIKNISSFVENHVYARKNKLNMIEVNGNFEGNEKVFIENIKKILISRFMVNIK